MTTEPTLTRRRALGLLAGAGASAVVLAACGKSSSSDDAATPSTSASTAAAGRETTTGATESTSVAGASCDVIPEETAGPFPGDGSNGPDILTQDGVVRRDITSSIGDASGTADGVPLTIELTIVDTTNSCAPLEGAAVYAWHCDREGRYSMYTDGAQDENYLRGVQAADADGKLTFTSVFPGAYSGRWPHVHFEIYESVADATGGGRVRATSQLALPKAACDKAYATSGYEQSVRNMARTSLDDDMVFADGYASQLGTVTGDAENGMTVTLTVPV
jgi:protocatechuate 3,4-dioxygenase beta subunit